jgi:hypothetical protein
MANQDKHGNPLIIGQRVLISAIVANLPTNPGGPIVVRIGDHNSPAGHNLSVHSKDLQSAIHGIPAGEVQTGPSQEVRKRTHVGLGEQDVPVKVGAGRPGRPAPAPGFLEQQEERRKQVQEGGGAGTSPTGIKPLVEGENRPLDPAPGQDAVGSESTPHTSPDAPTAPPAPCNQG